MSERTQDQPGDHRTAGEPVTDQIRQRAYELYLERGAKNGHSLGDWLQAEEEIKGSPVAATATD